MATSFTSRPSWQRNSIFRFFSSLKLAVVLLAVLIIGAIAGTLYESTFDAKVARAYVYDAPWFNIWLLLLASNLAVSAISRWPWKRHHVAFLITHLGIITLLSGSLIGRIWGVEGTITLFKAEPPTNRLLVDQHQLRVRDTDGIIKGYPAEFIHRPPTPQKPWDLGPLAGGSRLSLIDYAPAVEGKLNPRPLNEGGAPALHFTITTAMMNQNMESWLLADDHDHGTFNMGLATIGLKRGSAPPDTPQPTLNDEKSTGEVDIEETLFAFSKAPEEQIARVVKGGNSGAKVRLTQPSHDGGSNKGKVIVDLAGRTWTFDVAQDLGKDKPMDGSRFTLRIENYWPDFRIENGKPSSISDHPNNPAVVVSLKGKGLPVSATTSAHGNTPGVAPEMPVEGTNSPNKLTLFVEEDGGITYTLASRKSGRSSGKIEKEKPLITGWADWQLTVDRIMPHAQEWMDFAPVSTTSPATELPDGVRIRIQKGSDKSEQWIPAGWQVTVPTPSGDVQVAYGWKQTSLPIALELMEFEVERNEGSDSPAGFKSTVRVTNLEGQTVTGQCWMNNPFSHPGEWWRTWTGLTYKMSQASWNPENLGQSTIQILRDPGWSLKWIGSLLIVCGIFMLFYLKGFRRPIASPPPSVSSPTTIEEREESLVST